MSGLKCLSGLVVWNRIPTIYLSCWGCSKLSRLSCGLSELSWLCCCCCSKLSWLCYWGLNGLCSVRYGISIYCWYGVLRYECLTWLSKLSILSILCCCLWLECLSTEDGLDGLGGNNRCNSLCGEGGSYCLGGCAGWCVVEGGINPISFRYGILKMGVSWSILSVVFGPVTSEGLGCCDGDEGED